MEPVTGVHYIILIITGSASGYCSSLPRAEYKMNLKIVRDLQSMGSSTNSSSKITPQTVDLSKKIKTTLACLILLLTMIVYWLLMRYTTTLSNQVILPSKFLSKNIAAVLSVAWPRPYIGSPEETIEKYQFPWVLFSMKFITTTEADNPRKIFYEALGSQELKEISGSTPPSGRSIIALKSFSPIMKTLVEIAIWNSFSFWLVLVMIINTLVYNGFVSNNVPNDSIIRLVLIGVYVIVNFGY